MTKSSKSRRKGIAVVLAVVILAMINVMAIGSITSAGDDAEVSALRVETMRAFYAAEAGIIVTIRQVSVGESLPDAGSEIELVGATLEFVETPPEGESGVLVVEGRAGYARRRLQATLE